MKASASANRYLFDSDYFFFAGVFGGVGGGGGGVAGSTISTFGSTNTGLTFGEITS